MIDLDKLMAIATASKGDCEPLQPEICMTAFACVLELCLLDERFWTQFQTSAGASAMIFALVIAEPVRKCREVAVTIIRDRVTASLLPGPTDARATPTSLAAALWTICAAWMPIIAQKRSQAKQYLSLMHLLVEVMMPHDTLHAALSSIAAVCAEILLQQPSTECLARPLHKDDFIAGVALLLRQATLIERSSLVSPTMPR
jgi:hypothetical protein